MKRLFSSTPKSNPPKLRLFCLPFAGGSASSFQFLDGKLNPSVEVVLVNPPGRGARMADPAHDTMGDTIEELMAEADYVSSVPYIFFGHSLGSRVAYEFTKQLYQKGFMAPLHLIASGSRAPHISSSKPKSFDLPQDQFVAELKSLNGTPQELFAYPELLELLLPTLRADFKIAETYIAEQIELPIPITVFCGENDSSFDSELAYRWRELTTNLKGVFQFPGDHFFINQSSDEVIEGITRIINGYLQ